jgi:hypothetical protein
MGIIADRAPWEPSPQAGPPRDRHFDGRLGVVCVAGARLYPDGISLLIRFRSLLSDNFYPVNFLREFSENRCGTAASAM